MKREQFLITVPFESALYIRAFITLWKKGNHFPTVIEKFCNYK